MAKVQWLFLLALLPAVLHARDEAETITILGTADWKGRFAVDSSGRGGLAALRAFHSLLDHKKDRGHTLLFHTGAFTAAETPEQFQNSLRLPSPDLITYMRYAALGLTPSERSFRAKSSLSFPAPLFSADLPASAKDKPTSEVPGMQLAGGLIYATALDAPADRRADRTMANLWQNAAETKAAAGVILLPVESASAFFSAQHLQDVHSPAPQQGILIFLEPGKENRFYRDPAGPLVCSMQGRTVCVIELRIRGQKIISTAQRFVDLNSRDNPSAFIKPDPVLMDLFPGK
jgi:hypothetical protein